ncbi:MAG: hypothetical protein COC01_06380 [Bacteroidetes bacterium]|nr:MAG: hypothetical protein COC01_06380 [Bacteroidota bacterium]
MYRPIIFLIFCFFTVNGIGQSLSPEIATTSGDFSEGTNATLSWTIGEVMIETYNGSYALLTQGFNQPDSIESTIGINRKLLDITNFKVYPNPTHNKIIIEYSLERDNRVEISIYDIIGKKLQNIVNKSQNKGDYYYTFDFKEFDFQAGNYFLKIVLANEVVVKKVVNLR